jgi:hypothetical protein
MPETLQVAIADPSMADLRSMIERTGKPEAETPEIVTPEPKPQAEEKAPEPEPGTGKEPQQVEVEEELPDSVKKKIEKEAKKQAFFQSKIAAAVDLRKAAQKEFDSLEGKPGSEPAPTTAPTKDDRPIRPDLETFPGSLAEYKAAVAKHDTDFEAWIEKRSREAVSKELTERQSQEAGKKAWDEAATKHGAEFPSLMDTLRASVPPEMQQAISALDDWSGVAVHLAKNEAERAVLVEKFKTAPLAAIAQLGKLEDRLKPAAQPPADDKPPLPRPLKAVAGGPLGTAPPVDLEKASMSVFKGEINRMLARK